MKTENQQPKILRTEILCPECFKKKLLTENSIDAYCDNCGTQFKITKPNTVVYK